MEPFVSTAYVGPQTDDTLGAQRHYGDFYENNNTAATATDLGVFNEGWSWGESLISGALGSAFAFIGSRAMVKNAGNRFTALLFPPNGRAGSWNSFQTFCRTMPGLNRLSTAQRGMLWTEVVKRKVSGAPFDTLKKLFTGGVSFDDDPDKKKAEAPATTP